MVNLITSLHTVNGQHEPAYLETNMIANDRNTNTFRVIQEQTAFMAFEWKPMAHKDFNYVFLVQDVYFWSDVTAKVYEGNMGLLEAIGEPCEVSKYRAEGHNGNIFFSHFQTYDITYKRVPRIENVQIGLLSSPYRHLMWKRERSACEPTDSTIIFRGYSTQQLQMFTISSDKVEHYVKDFQTEEGIEEVFILFNKHGNRFSLPTMVITSLHTVNGQHEPAYLETNMIANDRNTNTFRVIQEQTAFMAFEWKPMAHKDFNYVFWSKMYTFGLM
uniref:Sortilin-related receptor n=1 Tax=Schistosoma mansoni TaxID=6183 RepID=A0A5K4FEH1_SCHMA